MALLQISEPGQAPDPHQRRIAIGIDLGTTHSLVASVRNGVAECLPDELGHVILPSAVRYLANGGRQIGVEAFNAQSQDPQNTIVSVKRLMGRGLHDITNATQLPYQLIQREGMVGIQTVLGEKSPVIPAYRYTSDSVTVLVKLEFIPTFAIEKGSESLGSIFL